MRLSDPFTSLWVASGWGIVSLLDTKMNLKPIPLFCLLGLISQLAVSADWYRGNTHVHTVLCGHADSTPEAVTKWYHDRGYNFLILSEHNKFIDPKTVKMPKNSRSDFILIPGEEVTGVVHTTAMNIDHQVDWRDEGVENPTQVIQNHVHRIDEAHGHTILNHPHGGTNIGAPVILPVEGLHLMEVYNANTKGANLYKRKGMGYPLTAEQIWDDLLTGGRFIYGVGADDAHVFKDLRPDKSNPGLGWVMVEAEELTPDAIAGAMLAGEFYFSSGVYLKVCAKNSDSYTVAIDSQATRDEISRLPDWSGLKVEAGVEGYRIEFIGPHGKILKTVRGREADYSINPSLTYVRARAVYTRKDPDRGWEEYYAWGQPVFRDKR